MAEDKEILCQTAGLLAEALGEGWRVDTMRDYTWQNTIFGPNDEVLYLSKADRTIHFSRVEISGGYNHLADKYDQYPRNLEHVKITVSRDRGPEVMAREINRRLLPKYREEMERVRESVARDREALSGKEASEKVMAEAAGDPRGYLSLPGHMYARYSVNYGGDAVSLDLNGIPVDLAVEIVKLLRSAQ